jgi:hypothetical protein
MHVIEAQSESLGIPHKVLFVGTPFLNSYQQRIKELWNEYGIELLFTGKHIFIIDFLLFSMV